MKSMYIIKIVIIVGVMLLWFTSTIVSVNALTNSTDNIGQPLYRQIQSLFDNPFFRPDYTCLFDAYQLHCIPGENQDCYDIEGFGENEDGTCTAKTKVNETWEWKCPDEYHWAEGDETGQCYPDTEPCYPGQVRNQTDPDNKGCHDERKVLTDHSDHERELEERIRQVNDPNRCAIGYELEVYPTTYIWNERPIGTCNKID